MYRFKSRSNHAPPESGGRQILKTIGKDDASCPDQWHLAARRLSSAIQTLQAAAAQHGAAQAQAAWGVQERGNGAWPRPHGIPLRQRAAPFIAMRQRCRMADGEIARGV